jgi:hypothetical protein
LYRYWYSNIEGLDLVEWLAGWAESKAVNRKIMSSAAI